MPPLCLGEGEAVEQATHLPRIVVENGGLEVLAHGSRLRELAPKPPKEADSRLRYTSHEADRTPPKEKGGRAKAAPDPVTNVGVVEALPARPVPGRRRVNANPLRWLDDSP